MPLKSETVEWIFTRMLVRYGSAWDAKWAGVPADAVKQDWATELERVPRDSILYALGYLPLEFPPTVAQFKAICLRAPEATPLAIRHDAKAEPELIQELIGKAEALRAARSPRQWAHDLKAKEERGEKLTPPLRAAWRKALSNEIQAGGGTYTPIDPRCLPPAMRQETDV